MVGIDLDNNIVQAVEEMGVERGIARAAFEGQLGALAGLANGQCGKLDWSAKPD